MSKSPRTPAPDADARPRGGAVRAVSDLLPDIGGAAFRKFGFVQSSVVTRWAEIVGARFAEVSAPERISFPRGKREQGTLHLVVRGAHGPILQHIVPEIIERVNRFFGYPAIAKVAMRTGALAMPAPRVPAPAPVAPAPLPAETSESLRAVADPELRAVLAALAAGVAGSSGPPRIGGGKP